MPAAITHYFHGKQVAKQLNLTAGNAFTLGCQGPDFWFCHRFFPWQRGKKEVEFGEFLHTTPPDTLLGYMQEIVENAHDPVLRAYFCGFLCHYALDRTCHPYVNALAEQLNQTNSGQMESIFHNEIESAIDVIILRRETGKLPGAFRLQDTMPCEKAMTQSVAPLYAELSSRYERPIARDVVEQAIRDAHTAFSALRDRFGLEYRFVRLVEGKGKRSLSCHFRPMLEAADVDYINLSGQVWKDKEGCEHTEDFFALFDFAVTDAAFLIKKFMHNEPLKPFCLKSF